MSDFATELPRRQEHLDGLPGRVFHEWCESLNRAARLFSRNSEELRDHLTQFVGKPIFVTELPEGFDSEAARLLVNYLAALAGLRDAQRVVHRRLWPEREEEDRACEMCGRSDPKRTKWEVEIWDPKREELLGDQRIAFLTKLRDYSLHYAIPLVTVASSWKVLDGPSGSTEAKNAVGIGRDELLKWDGWNKKARDFIKHHDSDTIEVMPLVAFFSGKVRQFISWFFGQIDNEVGQEIREFVDKHNDLQYWCRVHEASKQYDVLRNNHHLRKRVQARLDRANNKTGGWRVIAVDANGKCMVRESDWPPLPQDWSR